MSLDLPQDHPQRDELVAAQATLDELAKFQSGPRRLPAPVLNALEGNATNIQTGIDNLLDLSHDLVFVGEIGVGKDQPYSLIVPTPDGDRRWGNLRVGERLFGRDGLPTQITDRYEQGVKPVYRVAFDDGTFTFAGAEHLWHVGIWVRHRVSGSRTEYTYDVAWKTLTTSEIVQKGVRSGVRRQWKLPQIDPVQYDSGSVPIDPYTLGVWLGDGSAGTSIYTKPDLEIVERIRQTYQVTGNVESRWNISGIREGLKELGLFDCRSYERFIPMQYRHNDVTVRAEILRGLMDTDGTASANDHGTIEFYSSSEQLADHVAWLARSLGGKAIQDVKTDCGYRDDEGTFVPCRDSYTVTIRMPNGFKLFHLTRKQVLVEPCEDRYLRRWIDSIEYDHDEQTMCVRVEAEDSLYLCNDFIPTHNSTGISRMFDLTMEVPLPLKSVVLEAGKGRTTLCDVTISGGPEYSISIEPSSEIELQQLVSDFTALIFTQLSDQATQADEVISQERQRHLRNMTGLIRQRGAVDPAVELAKTCKTETLDIEAAKLEYEFRLMARIDSNDRCVTNFPYDDSQGLPMPWMAKAFSEINNGRQPKAPLPAKIILNVPGFLAAAAPLNISVIDTKGLDEPSIRADIDDWVRNQRAIIIMCSDFPDSPGLASQMLINHATKIGNSKRLILLVLPKHDDDCGMKDDSGRLVDDADEGREIKRTHIESALGSEMVPTLFFNATRDDGAEVRNSLISTVLELRKKYVADLQHYQETAHNLLNESEHQFVTVDAVVDRVRHFLSGNEGLGRDTDYPIYHELVNDMAKTRYASTIYACVRRNGSWSSFDIYHRLSLAAEDRARIRTRDWTSQWKELMETMLADSEYHLALGFMQQLETNMNIWINEFLSNVRKETRGIYITDLVADKALWREGMDSWGQGRGYCTKVAETFRKWFQEHPALTDAVQKKIVTEWGKAIRKLHSFLQER